MPDRKYIGKITIPGTTAGTYYIKDIEAREEIQEIKSRGIKFVIAWKGDAEPIVANIPAGVKVYYNETLYVGTMLPYETVEESGVQVQIPRPEIYLVRASKSTTVENFYNEYVAINEGTTASPVYVWEKIGDTDLDIKDLGALAYANTATGSTTLATTDSATFTGTSFSSTGTFTPSGTVAVTLKQTSTSADLTTSDYTPEGTVSAPTITVIPSTATVKVRDTAGSVTAGTAASFTQGSDSFTAATHGTDQYTSASWTGVVDDQTETLTISFTPGSFSSGAFNGGSFSQGSDTFSANTPTSVTLDTFKDQTVATGITSATSTAPTFTGTTAEDILVTGVSYDKATVQSQTFTGTAGNVSVSGTPTGDISLTKTDKTITVTVNPN